MKVILPYNTMVLSETDCFVEGLSAGSIVRGYHYNEKRIVDFPIKEITRIDPERALRMTMLGLDNSITFCGATKVLTAGGPIECGKAPFLLGVCHSNPRRLNTYNRIQTEELATTIKAYEIEWECQDFFLWAEGMLVGSTS